jgi:phosphosulfolactate phosphohydrolase-like enzyme
VRRYGDDWERPLRSSRSGRELLRLGFADDIRDASRLDAYPVSMQFHERRVTLLPGPFAGIRASSEHRDGVGDA